MRLLIAGGDARYACLAEQAHRAGWDVGTVGLEKAGGDFPRREVEAIGEAEAVLLCNPWRRGLVLPLAEKRIATKKFEDVAYFVPFYLKDFVAKTPRKLL